MFQFSQGCLRTSHNGRQVDATELHGHQMIHQEQQDTQSAKASPKSSMSYPSDRQPTLQQVEPIPASNLESGKVNLQTLKHVAAVQDNDDTLQSKKSRLLQSPSSAADFSTLTTPSDSPILAKLTVKSPETDAVAEQDEQDSLTAMDGVTSGVPETTTLSSLNLTRPKPKASRAKTGVSAASQPQTASSSLQNETIVASDLSEKAAADSNSETAPPSRDSNQSPTKGGIKLPGLGMMRSLKKTEVPSGGSTLKESSTASSKQQAEPEFAGFRNKLRSVNTQSGAPVVVAATTSISSAPEASSIKAVLTQKEIVTVAAKAIVSAPVISLPSNEPKPLEMNRFGRVSERTNERQSKASLSSQDERVANTSVHDLGAIKNRLRNVGSKSSLNGSQRELAANDTSSELAALRTQLKATGNKNVAAASQNTTSSNATSGHVPEFMSVLNKMKGTNTSSDSQKNLASDQTTPSRASSASPSKGAYNRFGAQSSAASNSSTALRSSVEPSKQSYLNTYKAPAANKFVSMSETSKVPNVSLKSVRTDVSLSSTGGSVRPKDPLLLVIKGKKKVSAKKVPLKVSSLNMTDAFVLDTVPLQGEKSVNRLLFVCTGEKTSKVRRTKAIEMANLIKDFDYCGKADIILVELSDIKDRVVPDKEMLFWQTLLDKQGLSGKSAIIDAVQKLVVNDGVDDNEFEKRSDEATAAYKFTDKDDGTEVAASGKELKVNLLNSNVAIVVDCKTEIYVWAGKSASEDDKAAAVAFAEARGMERIACPVLMEGERFERTIFKTKFEDWPQGKELNVYNVLEVKAASNIKAKDKEWRVYDRGSDVVKVNKVDIVRMYDKNSSPELSIAKNTESLDIDPAELIRKDWGFKQLRIWQVNNLGNKNDVPKTVQIDASVLEKFRVHFDADHPFVFDSDKCYIFLYEYKEKPAKMADQVLADRLKIEKEDLIASMKENAIMYTWAGSDSSVTDQAFMAHIAVEMEKLCREGKIEVCAKARHVRTGEGKEPVHFLNMIRGGNIPRDQPDKILEMLPKAAITPCPVVVVRRSLDKMAMFHVFGPHRDLVRIGQLYSVSASQLSSASSFVIVTERTIFVWNGRGSFQWEQDSAKHFATDVLAKLKGAQVVTIQESLESADFWKAIGGQAEYDNSSVYSIRPSLKIMNLGVDAVSLAMSQAGTEVAPYDVRIWRLNFFTNGNPTATEICPFSSQDLEDDAVFILDCYFALYVWIGCDVARNKINVRSQNLPALLSKVPLEQLTNKSAASGFRDLRLAVETAIRYADYVADRENGRLNRNSTYVVQSGAEPLQFKSQFVSWKPRSAAYDNWPSNINIDKASELIDAQKYSISELRKFSTDRVDLPFGIDLERLETYLDLHEFSKIFGMEREKFAALPQWKQTDLKKKLNLF